jgi:hypothetical protein
VETALQRAGSALYRDTVQMLLQRNTELALSEPRNRGGLLYEGCDMGSKEKKTISSSTRRKQYKELMDQSLLSQQTLRSHLITKNGKCTPSDAPHFPNA